MRKVIAVLLSLWMAGPAWADGTIDTLSAGTTLGGTEQIPMFQTANPAVTTTPAALATYLGFTTGILSGAGGGTGVANTGKTITIGGNVTFSGASTFTGTLSGNTSVTFPTSGTLVNTGVAALSSLVSVGTLTTGALGSGFTAVAVAQGGTNCSSASITCFNNITGFTAGGTTGTTSTNLVFSTSPTFAGTVTLPETGTLTSSADNFAAATTVTSASFGLTGNISAAAWTTNGIRYKNVAATLTDTTSNTTVATVYNDVWGGNTNAASNATTYTNIYGSYFKAPIQGTNVTFTNKYALGADSANFASLALTLGSDATGDIYYRNSSGVLARLGIGSSTQVLTVSGGLPSWAAAGGGSSTITANSTATSGFTAGQVLYSDGSLVQASTVKVTGGNVFAVAGSYIGVSSAAAMEFVSTAQYQIFVNNSGPQVNLASTGTMFSIPSNYLFAWSGTSNNAGAALDTTMARQAAGVVEINSGTGAGAGGTLLLATLTASATVKTGGYTVAGLPAAGTAGRKAYVTDQLTACVLAGAALTGGGAVVCPVFDNGTAWVGD